MEKLIEVKRKINIFLSLFLVLFKFIPYLQAYEFGFPQGKIDRVCFGNQDRDVVSDTKEQQNPFHIESSRNHINMNREVFTALSFTRTKDISLNTLSSYKGCINEEPCEGKPQAQFCEGHYSSLLNYRRTKCLLDKSL